MRFFIRKRNKNWIAKALRSTFFLVSAIAVFNGELSAQDKAQVSSAKKNPADSVLNARLVFEKLQSSALEILPLSTRLDMLDYWDVDSVYKASNAMEGLSWLESVSPSYLKVRITPVSVLEIKILPAKKDNIFMTVYTVGDNIQSQDSDIKFYDAGFNELPFDKHMEMPRVKDFFEIPKGSATKMKEIEEMIPFPTITFNANPENDNLEARLTVEKYMNQDDWNIVKLFAKPGIIMEWKKEKYKTEK